YVGQKPVTEISLDAFPGDQRTSFDYYDDDGSTYAYEHGAYFRQSLSLQQHGDTVTFRTGKPEGSFHPALRTWLLKIHGHAAQAVQVDGKPLAAQADAATLQRTDTAGWATGKDRYGPVTWVRLPAGKTTTVTLHDRREAHNFPGHAHEARPRPAEGPARRAPRNTTHRALLPRGRQHLRTASEHPGPVAAANRRAGTKGIQFPPDQAQTLRRRYTVMRAPAIHAGPKVADKNGRCPHPAPPAMHANPCSNARIVCLCEQGHRRIL